MKKCPKKLESIYTYFISEWNIKSTVDSMFINFGSLLEISYLDLI